MSHPFGDLIAQHLHRKHGLSQSKLAAGILQSPSVITDMCQGKRLSGPQARQRVTAIIGWLRQQGVLTILDDANALLNAAGMAPLHPGESQEAALLRQLNAQSVVHHHPINMIPSRTNLLTPLAPFGAHVEEIAAIQQTNDLADEAKTATLKLATQIRHGEFGRLNPDLPRSIRPVSSDSSCTTPKHNLPAQTTPLIGRVRELTDLADLLAEPATRLVTILGAGGMGKTHLAIAVAWNQVEQFTSGVYFVVLAPLTDAEYIVPTIAEAIHFQFQADGCLPKQQLLDYLRQKQMLLVLDNFEHLLAGVALIHELLQSSPGLKLLVTTRERLQLSSETIWTLGGLDFPYHETPKIDLEYSAIELFRQTARRARPSFQLDATHWPHVARICQLVGGMPLGVILATGWVEILSPAEIAADLAQGFDLLETKFQDLPDRQRNLHALVAYSWQQLAESERNVFMQLSVFRGGFTRAAAQVITGVSLPTMTRLVNKSFVQHIKGDWYEIHELLRQYGAEQLAQIPLLETTARERHCVYYCIWLQQQESHLKGARQQEALAQIKANLQNVRVAWHWAVAHDQVERIAEALESLNRFYEWRGTVHEGESVCRHALERLTPPSSSIGLYVVARLLVWQGVFCRSLGDVIRSQQLLQQSIAILDGLDLLDQDTRPQKAFALLHMGGIDREETKRFRLESLNLYRAMHDKWGTALALQLLAGAYLMVGDHGMADQLLEESLEIREGLGYHIDIVNSLNALGLSALDRGEHEKAEELVRKSLAIVQNSGNPAEIAVILRPLGTVLLHAGKFDECIAKLEECLEIYTDQGRFLGAAVPYANLGNALVHIGRCDRARTLIEPVLAESCKLGNQFGIGYCLIPHTMIALATEMYDQAMTLAQESATIWQKSGHQFFLGQALALSGFAACKLGNFSLAQRSLAQALSIGTKHSVILPLLYTLPGVALLFAKQGKYEESVELYATATRHPHIANSHWFADVAGKQIALVARMLPPDVVTAAEIRGRQCDLWETAARLLTMLQNDAK